MKSQFWTQPEIEIFQLDALNRLLDHVQQHTPYYRQLFAANNIPHKLESIEQLGEIPFLDKEIVRQNFESLKASNLPASRFKSNSTSGSTGTNFQFFSDKENSIIRQALNLRCDQWMSRNKDMTELKIWGASWDIQKKKGIKQKAKEYFSSITVVSGYNLSDADLQAYAELITSQKPRLITSYPSILHLLAGYFKDNALHYQPLAIKSAGEKLYPSQRELIEEVFQTKVYDFYGARDIPIVAMQCGHDTGLHIMAENVILEVVDELGNPIKEGEGELVLTDLHNYVFPFIRYKIGDRARISGRICSCGRGLPLIEEVLGRTFDIIQFPNGNRVGGTFWTLVMKSVPGIKDFQVIQTSLNNIRVKYVPDKSEDKDQIEILTKNIKRYSGEDLVIDFEKVTAIPLTAGGKHQYVISKK